ncbi:MAG: hypothetical protein QM773_00655 [Hyphomonadaceae bacterium]
MGGGVFKTWSKELLQKGGVVLGRHRYLFRNLVLSFIGLWLAIWLGGVLPLNFPAWLFLCLVPLFLIVPHIILPDDPSQSWQRALRNPKRLLLICAVYLSVAVVLSHLLTGNWIFRTAA